MSHVLGFGLEGAKNINITNICFTNTQKLNYGGVYKLQNTDNNLILIYKQRSSKEFQNITFHFI